MKLEPRFPVTLPSEAMRRPISREISDSDWWMVRETGMTSAQWTVRRTERESKPPSAR